MEVGEPYRKTDRPEMDKDSDLVEWPIRQEKAGVLCAGASPSDDYNGIKPPSDRPPSATRRLFRCGVLRIKVGRPSVSRRASSFLPFYLGQYLVLLGIQ
ncbi:hypothetical protein EVAR_39187_1 [Eumeta japonica]|uniref:Uncharacterized protein n=1 Tax=Eumeta variegata TaxID=151549 RepID=A0A4C1VP67_EUMVA|nr:hypothetical protein EVAR_39187_1 [Eumeta japonica]